MRYFTKNTFFNPSGSGVILTENRKLATIPFPFKSIIRFDDLDGQMGDTELRFWFGDGMPDFFRVWEGTCPRMKVNTGTWYYPSAHIWPLYRGQSKRIRIMLGAGEAQQRSVTFWFFGKKISKVFTYDWTWATSVVTYIERDSDGRTWVDGEDRGIWPD